MGIALLLLQIRMPKPSAQELAAAFKVADKDGNGKLKAEELKELMLKFAENDEEKGEVESMAEMVMAMCDQDGDKELKYEELLPLITGEEPDPKQQMRLLFKMWDTDSSGFVSREELCKAM